MSPVHQPRTSLMVAYVSSGVRSTMKVVVKLWSVMTVSGTWAGWQRRTASGRPAVEERGQPVERVVPAGRERGEERLGDLDRLRAVPVEDSSSGAGVARHEPRVGEQREVLGDA